MACRMAGGGRLHHHGAAFGRDLPAVLDERAIPFGALRRGQGHLQEAVAGQVQRCLLAGAEPHLAHRHGNQPVIADSAADQRRIAAAPDGDHTLVADLC